MKLNLFTYKTKKLPFEIRVLSVLAAVWLLVITIGILTYQSLHGIVEDVKLATRPDTKTALLKQVITDLYDAENSVKSYRLTGDENYLPPFYDAVFNIDERMNELHRQSFGDAKQRKLADSIENLVVQKYDVLSRFLVLQPNEKVTAELNAITEKLRIAEEGQANNASSPPPKKTMLQRIFGARKQNQPPAPPVNLGAIEREVEKVQKEQLRQLQRLQQEELELNRTDKFIMDKIKLVVHKMENNVKTAAAHKAISISKNARQTNLYIILFCLLTTGLLGAICFIIITFVQKNRAYRKALKNAKEQAENLAKTKETFLANMSHEIRTPMNAVAGFTEQVLQTRLGKTQRNQLEIVKKSADHLLHIINDILDYSKIQSGKFTFDTVGFNPVVVAKEAALLMQAAADEKNIFIKFNPGKNVPNVLIGDPVRLRQVLLNIIGNAVKFTEQGLVDIRLSAVKQEENIYALQVSVQDTGIGIPENQIKKIFNEFEQADSGISRKYGGTGLGLTITRKLIELQNGTIEISSQPTKGTKVNVIIPYKAGQASDIETIAPLPETQELPPGIKILIADDEPYNRMLIEVILKKWQVVTTMVTNGKEALEEVKNNEYDIVLMDIRMPVLNGIEATQAIRQLKNKKAARLPIIALTATTRQKEIDECKAAGITDVLPKPFAKADLLHLLLRYTGNTKGDPAMETPEKTQVEGAPAKYDLEELRHLSNGEEGFVKEMVRIFITTTRSGIADMEAALAAQQWEQVADYAHKIVPPCRHLKANTLLEKLKTIELQIRDEGKTDNLSQLVTEAKEEAKEIIALLHRELGNIAAP